MKYISNLIIFELERVYLCTFEKKSEYSYPKSMKISIYICSIVLLACAGCTNQVEISDPEPFLPVPNPAQLNWHKAEYILFAHFGMKTFYTGSDHMGYGK